ncbi:MAG: aspartoacylase [Cyanobium sp. ELA712]
MAVASGAEPLGSGLNGSAAEGPQAGAKGKVLVVAGTHGNECNAPWLLDAWARLPGRLDSSGLALCPLIGNPDALAQSRRYLDRDLNRSFQPALLADPARQERELVRARSLLADHAPEAADPCLVVIDLHSTTAAMGNCLVVYGRRPADLALAAALQQKLGLPVYLHEGDPHQNGYLAEAWPCGLVIEVGPVPQGVLTAAVVLQTAIALEATLALLAGARQGRLPQPTHLVVHRHRQSLDLPRHGNGSPAAVIHPLRQHRDWQPMRAGDPLFLATDGGTIAYSPPAGLENQLVWPVFINEAAYGEKGIALSLTSRERWPVQPSWSEALQALTSGLLQA